VTQFASERPLWNDSVWDQLLESIEREQVIPIVGPGLSLISAEDGEIPLEKFLAVELGKRFRIDGDNDVTLSDIVAGCLKGGRPIDELYTVINTVLSQSPVEAAGGLRKLAKIENFKLFVTTSFDLLLEQAIDQERFNGARQTVSLGYNKRDVQDCDVRGSLRRLQNPVVYHLLGKLSPLREYVLSDDDLLEFIYDLHNGPRPEQLFDALRANYLLLLGGNFSDWLVRLFLRLVKGSPLSYPRPALEILADDRAREDASLVAFLSVYSPTTRIFSGSAPEFIDELWKRWSARTRDRKSVKPDGQRAVFISYAREDRAALTKLSAGLGAAGFTVWTDELLRPGEAYDARLRKLIDTCAVFVPLLSQNTERDVRDAYFRREWHFAEERDTRNFEDVRFILPLVIDGTSRSELRTVPRVFLKKHILSAPGGEPTEEVLTAITEALGAPR